MKLTPKTQDFNPGRKIFINYMGNHIISEDEVLPEGFFLGADIPSEEGLYTIISSVGAFVIKVSESLEVFVNYIYALDFDNANMYSFLINNDTNLLAFENDVITDAAGPILGAMSEDGGVAYAAFTRSSANLRLFKSGEEGEFSRTIDLTNFTPPMPTINQTNRGVFGILCDENGWYTYVTFDNGSGGTNEAYLMFTDFENSANDNYIFIGKNSVIDTLDSSTFRTSALGNYLTFDPDKNLVLLWNIPNLGSFSSPPSGSQAIIKFDRGLNLLYRSSNSLVTLIPDAYTYDGEVESFDGLQPGDYRDAIVEAFNMTNSGNMYYVSGSVVEWGEDAMDWEWKTYLLEFEDTGSDFILNRFSPVFHNQGNNTYTYHLINMHHQRGDTLYLAGTLWSNPILNNFEVGGLLIKVNTETLTADWVERNWESRYQGYLDWYYVSSTNDYVYCAGYDDTFEFSIQVYDAHTGDFMDDIGNSDWGYVVI